MKKIFSLLAAVLFAGSMMAETVTLSYADKGYENAASLDGVAVVESGVTFTLDKATGTTPPAYYNSGTGARTYGGNTLTIYAGSATISKIVFDFSQNNKDYTVNTGTYTKASSEWTGSASSVVFTAESGSGHNRIKSIEVTLDGGSVEPLTPAEQLQLYISDLTMIKEFVAEYVEEYAEMDIVKQIDQWIAAGNTALTLGNEALINAAISQVQSNYESFLNDFIDQVQALVDAELDNLLVLVPEEYQEACLIIVNNLKEVVAGIEWDFNKSVEDNLKALETMALEYIQQANTNIDKIINPAEPITCLDVYQMAKGDVVDLLNDVTVTFANGKNVWVRDGSASMLIYLPAASEDFGAGQILSGVAGTVDIYNGLYEIKLTADQVAAINIMAGETLAPIQTVVVETADMNKYIVMPDVAFEEDAAFEEGSQSNITMNGVPVRNQFKNGFAFEAGKTYNIYGVVTIYSNNPQVYFIDAEETGIVEPTAKYFLTGDFREWAVTDEADYQFKANPANEGEYMLEGVSLSNGGIKVIGILDEDVTWYPDGGEAPYQITADGEYNIYFRPEGGVDGWFFGYFYVAEKPFEGPTNCVEAAAAAMTVSKNNELYNEGYLYTIKGYVTEIAYDWSAQNKNMSFWMADEPDGGKVLEAYKCYVEDEAGVVKVGDFVAVTGALTKFNSTPEFAPNCTVEILEPYVPVPVEEFNLTGTFRKWETSIEADYQFVENPAAEGEYMLIGIELSAGDSIKVIGVLEPTEGEPILTWYPDGLGNNCPIDADGIYDIYFRPDGKGAAGWYEGYFFVAEHVEPEVPSTCAEARKAILELEDGAYLLDQREITLQGYVTEIVTAYSEQHGNISFWMADESDGGQVIQAYRASCSAEEIPVVGDLVKVIGKMQKYVKNDVVTPEFAQGCTVTIIDVPVEPVQEYYLVGSFNEWAVEEDYLFVENPANPEEYMLKHVSLSANDEIKVKGVYGESILWYPDNADNFVIVEDGMYNIYFRPNADGAEDWYQGCFFVEPFVAQVIEITIEEGEFTDYVDYYGWWLVQAVDDNYGITLSNLDTEIEQAAGTYTVADLNAAYSYILTETDSVNFVDGSIELSVDADGMATITGTLVGSDGNTYILNIVCPAPNVYEYDDDSDFIRNFSSYTINSQYLSEYGDLYIEAQAADGYQITLDLYVPNGADGLVAGTYEINDSYEAGSVASGILYNGYVYPSNAAIVTEDGLTNVWYLVSGTVVVDENLNITVNALNSLGHSIAVTMSAEIPSGIEETIAAGKATKILRNGQLMIRKGDKTFNVMGATIR